MSSTTYHAVYMRDYRKNHPEYIDKSKIITNEFLKNKYNNNLEYKEHKKKLALERYYRIKEQKQNKQQEVLPVSVN